MKEVFILRGIPGSGKSTIAERLGLGYSPNDVVVHSTDNYFYDEKGNYNFDPKKLGYFHALNLMAFTKSCNTGVEVVVLDNTNTKHREYKKYVKVAEEMGYRIHILTIGDFDIDKADERNTHGVPREAIEKMAERFQR